CTRWSGSIEADGEVIPVSVGASASRTPLYSQQGCGELSGNWPLLHRPAGGGPGCCRSVQRQRGPPRTRFQSSQVLGSERNFRLVHKKIVPLLRRLKRYLKP